MRKFTVFTVILTIIIVVVVAEIVVNEYLPELEGEDQLTLELPDSIETNVFGDGLNNYLGADSGVAYIPDKDLVISPEPAPESEPEPVEIDISVLSDSETLPLYEDVAPDYSTSELNDFENENFASPSMTVYLREEQIKSAGFVGAYLENEPPNGRLYKTIFVDDLYDVEVDKTVVRTSDDLLAKVYVFKIGINADISEVYNLLKMRASEGVGIELNETNEFGAASFYMNDSRRAGTAFLTVRIGGLIYGFSYPKEYHSQIKNLIQLIEWDLG